MRAGTILLQVEEFKLLMFFSLHDLAAANDSCAAISTGLPMFESCADRVLRRSYGSGNEATTTVPYGGSYVRRVARESAHVCRKSGGVFITAEAMKEGRMSLLYNQW